MQFTRSELDEILNAHNVWLAGDSNGKRADLRGANLHEADLRGANLHEADLRGANLHGANLHGANLHGANLHGANLYEADLRGANLRGADLRGADLYEADLRGANLYEADLRGANLRGADLRGADLREADLREANLREANLHIEAVLSCTRITPEGALIGWKKCLDEVIVKVRIPEEARRSNATGRKCRAEFVDVLEVIGGDVGISTHDGETTYRVGERVTCNKWDENRWNECAGGIHFFITRYEAEQY